MCKNSIKKFYISLVVFLFSVGFIRLHFMNEIPVNSQSEVRYLIPSGKAVGMKLKTKGVMVVGVEQNGHLPAKKAGIKVGDIIQKVNETTLQNTRHFEEILETTKEETLLLTVLRKEKECTLKLTPTLNQSNQYVCGFWLRDSAAGIGTVTFFTEDKSSFVALGHPVNDMDTDLSYSVRLGYLELVDIKGAKQAQKGRPGELIGVLSGEAVGRICENTASGIRGNVKNQEIVTEKKMPVAKKNEVKNGKATILSTVSEEGTKEYEIEILRILDNGDYKDFVIEVTDSELLSKTGGIVQGMSGSPILQNGKIVGAVTHVFVNDSKKGYGIFIENMLADNE